MNFQDFHEAKNASNKDKAMLDLLDALKSVFNKYDLNIRKTIWERLTSPQGKELVNKIVKNPKTYLSDSEFIKLLR